MMSLVSSPLSAAAMARAFAFGTLSPLDVLESALNRLETVDSALNVFCFVDAERGRAMARASCARWEKGTPLSPFDGIPVAIKDTGHVPGWPTRLGSKATPHGPSLIETPGIARLREAGAVFFCKTTTPEFGWKGLTHGPLTGITRNPFDPRKTPGGSSGGSAVAVACGVVPVATGGDGGGSIRIPAAFTGVFGLKPSFGLVPNFTHAIGELGVFGGLSRTVEDGAQFLRVLTRPDSRDEASIPYRDIDYAAEARKGVKGLRIAYGHTLGFPAANQEVERAVLNGLEALAAAGAEIKDVSLDFTGARAAMDVIWRSGMGQTVAGFSAAQLQVIEPALLDLFVSSRGLKADDLQNALEQRRALSRHMQLLHEDHDLLVTPTIPIPAFEAGINTPDAEKYPNWLDWTPLTWLFNLSAQPAASVPCGVDNCGMPVGMQIVAARFREDLVLRASAVIESAIPAPLPTFPPFER